jgi:hypothetical protein
LLPQEFTIENAKSFVDAVTEKFAVSSKGASARSRVADMLWRIWLRAAACPIETRIGWYAVPFACPAAKVMRVREIGLARLYRRSRPGVRSLSRKRIIRFGFPLAIAFLVIFNVWQSHILGQSRTMYDDPIYRWRESVAIALSRMQEKPLHGYLAYQSIRNYLIENGLGLLDEEATQLPTWSQLTALIHDPARLEKLFQGAARTPIDYKLLPVPLVGNEKGLSDYYYVAFQLFGIKLTSLWLFYFLLLAFSILLFYLTYRNSPSALVLLLVYLIAHLSMVGYAQHSSIVTVHNSRFLPVLAILPSLHLLLLMLRRERPTPWRVAAAGAQTFLLFFVVFCRLEAIWQVFALLAVGLIGIIYSIVLNNDKFKPSRPALVIKAIAVNNWPAIVIGVWLVTSILYAFIAVDSKVYGSAMRTHVFWHSLYGGTVSASPQLTALYSYGEPRYSDTMVYMAVLVDLRARNDTSSEIAYVHNGDIQINIMKSMGEYDRLVKHVFFQVVTRHPWLVLKSFVVDKPLDQIVLFWKASFLSPSRHTISLAAGIVGGLLLFATGARYARRFDVPSNLTIVSIIFLFCWMPALVAPSAYSTDVLMFILILVLLLLIVAMRAMLRRVVPPG